LAGISKEATDALTTSFAEYFNEIAWDMREMKIPVGGYILADLEPTGSSRSIWKPYREGGPRLAPNNTVYLKWDGSGS
jgi:hypothetical protein